MKSPSHRVASRTHESNQTMTVPSCFSSSIRLVGVALAAMLLLGACGKDAANDAKAAQQAVDPNLVVAQPTLVQRLKVAPVGKQPIAEHLRVPGQIAFDEQRV
ncbi:hypothetical protein NLQ78_23810, partial [Escherichia coli]|nr:hypothetical protein [Escherichia coli]